jgi:hypothetical protein
MNLYPIYPKPPEGLEVICSECSKRVPALLAFADLDAFAGTYCCSACAREKTLDALDKLRKRATEYCEMRNHLMEWQKPTVYSTIRVSQIGECKLCGKQVIIETKPLPNSISIGGPAVALNCGDPV